MKPFSKLVVKGLGIQDSTTCALEDVFNMYSIICSKHKQKCMTTEQSLRIVNNIYLSTYVLPDAPFVWGEIRDANFLGGLTEKLVRGLIKNLKNVARMNAFILNVLFINFFSIRFYQTF
jgi:hypothetical protein